MESLFQNVMHLLTFESIIFAALGVFIGIIIGALPGLSVNLALSLMIPITYAMDFNEAIMMLLGVFVGGVYGGSISAILISTPGTPAAAATVLDGYAMAQNGKGGTALAIATVGSFFGGMIGVIALIFVSPILGRFGLKFGPAEVFSLMFFGIAVVVSLSEQDLLKSLIASVLGLVLGLVGVDVLTGVARYTFGNMHLYSGLSSVSLMIGLFAMSVMFHESGQMTYGSKVSAKLGLAEIKESFLVLKRHIFLAIRSGLLGTFIGVVPGPGATAAAFVAYNDAKTSSRNPENFGKGEETGVLAPETANNGVNGGALIPLLTLGIPGDTGTALLLGAFVLHGMTPGPLFFTEHPDIVYFIFVGMVVIFLMQITMGLSLAKLFIKVLEVPKAILIPMVIILCFIGAYAANQSILDVIIMVVAGVIGFAFKRLGYPPAPLILSFILGPGLEEEFRRSLIISKGSYSIFVEHPISCALLVCSIVSLAISIIRRIKNDNKA